ncbi:hypothetical protein Pmar_PMAR015991 [Perkinsus marinus ATCC 50983]|uniref:Uncharacterized protein n=1 Tax=Perkinsus marinus (strain ATCC 50983 / TXsc) TaxID=423536 RepID=C5LTM0_PERM5|nr:hypothetical protein Pmar_PMAR015991 [Perkinsus marinus ATCC 50983]EEQ99931.1 hypothetical protein Pmar_PMAR015991 [Perkinsus marinus ATCC 50983]|eukprot:XP_002767214.1 hypothetical protein Pmar_PMAR015991 [Perkinsus marinus ATCC 50983]
MPMLKSALFVFAVATAQTTEVCTRLCNMYGDNECQKLHRELECRVDTNVCRDLYFKDASHTTTCIDGVDKGCGYGAASDSVPCSTAPPNSTCVSECNRLNNDACKNHPKARVECRCDRYICRNMYYTNQQRTALCVHGIDKGCNSGLPVSCPPGSCD